MQGVRKSALFLRYLTSLITGKGFRAKYVSGTLLQSETPINLLFLGSNDHISEIFFEDIVKTEFLGSFHPLIWGQARSRFIRPGTDIIIVPHLPWNRLTNNTYVIPAYLESKLSLPTTKDEFMVSLKGNNRRIVKQGLKNGIEFEQANTEKDYREFYEQMFIPLVTNRHGVNAFVSSFSSIYSKAANATLIFAKLNRKRVGGVQLIWPNFFKSYSYFNKIGMINEIIHDPKRFSQVNMALYYQMCCLSIEKRCFCLNLGIVPPLLNNGLLWFKESYPALP